ncbi:MAG: hypothetical protein ACPGZU_09510 [Ketobacter sp.]|jgi:hypothetical protein|uniref:hypothetical protein n=1 Tax=unclassified Ketobacter TaxID=2639109 RepID=UPI0025BE8026|nr:MULTISPECIES: hypothetical protein [unclassified Ketobacter]|tara:strand:- start:1874 stop:2161 length:288 start_codon:yes stop_codon:yes gene_type:complete
MKTSELTGRGLDYEMYRHACKVSGKTPSDAEFEQGYQKGQFHFHQDKALLLDLMETYKINTQYLAQEWLASTTRSSAWGETPLIAVCRLVLILSQ